MTHVSSPLYDVNAYQAKLKGLHPLLLAIQTVCTFRDVTFGSILIG